MSLFTQEPWWIVGIGAIVIVVLTAFFLKTGAKPFVPAIGGVVAVVAGLVLLERLIVTDEEELRQTLNEIIVAVESGDLDAVLAHLHPSASGAKDRARYYLNRYTVHYITINIREIIVDSDQEPPTACLSFTFNAQVSPNPYGRNPIGGLVLHFTRENDRWLVHAHEERFGPAMFKKMDAT